jgi:hypothetical protein
MMVSPPRNPKAAGAMIEEAARGVAARSDLSSKGVIL